MQANHGIGIVGYGVVGKSIKDLLGASNRPVAVYDPMYLPVPGLFDKDAINDCGITFVCVPTPTGPGGECDTSIVEEVCRWIKSDIIVLRSTVAPGTTDRLRQQTGKRIIFQPEYIGETVAHPLLDHLDHPFIILGGPIEDTTPVADLYKEFYHSSLHIHQVDCLTAELTKYMENSFYAVKVAFVNEFYDICRAFGVSFDQVRECWLADPRISRDHTFVYPNNRGFGGKCLPKDVSAIIQASLDRHCHPTLLLAAMRANSTWRHDDPTWSQYMAHYPAESGHVDHG